MPRVARLTDIGSAHESWPDTDVIEGSEDTTVNSLDVHCVSHEIREHGSPSPSPTHQRFLAEGSPDTTVNSLAVGRIGDPVDCGGFIITGSHDTDLN